MVGVWRPHDAGLWPVHWSQSAMQSLVKGLAAATLCVLVGGMCGVRCTKCSTVTRPCAVTSGTIFVP
jgi:hypothetical protein